MEQALQGKTVLITGQGSIETAVAAFRRGVVDYLTKPVDFARVRMVIENVSRVREVAHEPTSALQVRDQDRKGRED